MITKTNTKNKYPIAYMSKVCPHCHSGQYYTKTKRLCIKCRGQEIEEKYRERNNGKAPSFTSDYLFDQYYINKKPLREISVENDTTAQNIRYWLVKFDIPIRSIKEANGNRFDSDFFKKLNSKSAFLLGYLFTDGDLLFNKRNDKYFLRLYSKYRDNIKNVKKLLKTDAKIQFRKEKFNEKVRQGAVYFISIADQVIIQDIMELGMVYDKNQSIKFPEIPKKLHSHFIRGLWAGSGSVCLEKGYLLRSKIIIGSIDLITEVERILNTNGLSKRNISKSSHSKKPSYSFRYNTIEDQKKLFHFLYHKHYKDSIELRQYEQYTSYFAAM